MLIIGAVLEHIHTKKVLYFVFFWSGPKYNILHKDRSMIGQNRLTDSGRVTR